MVPEVKNRRKNVWINFSHLEAVLQYVVIFVILVAIAVLGVFTGIALRKRKDAKELALHEDKKEEK